MKKWITSDWHLGEDRFEIMGRPFDDVRQHMRTILFNYNDVVSKDDLVYVNGDVCYQKFPEFLPYVEQFNGSKILIRGNHDSVIPDEEFKKYFVEIIPEGEGVELEVEGLPCYITHYPTRGKLDRFNLVGHIHTAWKYQLNSFNVGVDVHHFRPVNLETIPFHYKAICEYYDEDVWVGYKEINEAYRGKRGKKGSYFKSKPITERGND